MGLPTAPLCRELTANTELAGVLLSQWGAVGLPPEQAALPAALAALSAFTEAGAAAPCGGGGAFAAAMIPVIEGGGGHVLTQARVQQILIGGGRRGPVVEGVELTDRGGESHILRAPVVISAAGVLNTYRHLVPQSYRHHFASHLQVLSAAA
eukprot:SM004182S15633  [mRNA]  locus=s4182:160:725:- [translate_table: standard]